MAYSTPKDPLALEAGDLRHSITILQPWITMGSSGAETSYTAFLSDVRAKIEPMRGTDIVKSGMTTTQTFLTVTIRYVSGITAQMQVQRQSGATYIIQAIENVLERNRVLKLLCLDIGGVGA
jgi:SPP1 family predicted phage head-tail adaptor